MNDMIFSLKLAVSGKDAKGIITEVLKLIPPNRIVLASSLSAEDQVLTHIVCSAVEKPRIFTIDTGRLFPEIYETMERSMERYGFHYEVLAPNTSEIEGMVGEHGPNLFYRSIELRKLCCSVRKIHPLMRVLSTADAWVCGLRRDQAITRTETEPIEWDDENNIIKINPLFDWSEGDVWKFIRQNDIPYNPLHDRGFRSIGCAPCTRAIGPDDDVRAGRWWWEEPEHKECGLHNRQKQN